VMDEAFYGPFETALVPTGVSFGAKKDRSLVVVDAMYLPAFRGKIETNLGADKTRRTGY
jgi:hypothetical protein